MQRYIVVNGRTEKLTLYGQVYFKTISISISWLAVAFRPLKAFPAVSARS